MSGRARHQRKPDPSDRCFPAAFQGLTITRELQPNGLHPSNFQGHTTTQFKPLAIVPHVIVSLAIVGTTLRNDPHRFVSRRVIVARVLNSKH